MPQPASGGGLQLHELAEEPIGTASQFTIPATSNGMVYVGTRDGNVLGFGASAGERRCAGRSGSRLRANRRRVGRHPDRDRDRGADRHGDRDQRLLGRCFFFPFTVGRVTQTSPPGTTRHVRVTFPVTLRSGDTLHVPATFAPAAPGGTTGRCGSPPRPAERAGHRPAIADATRTGLYATVPSVALRLSLNDGTEVGPVPVGHPNTRSPRSSMAAPLRSGSPRSPGRVRLRGPVAAPAGHRPAAWPVCHRAVRLHPELGCRLEDGTHHHREQRHASEDQAVWGERPCRSKFTAPQRISFGHVPVGHTATRFIHIVNAGNEAPLPVPP